jgi:hypothetical protein
MAARRTRIERGLYQDGDVYYACATPPGSRTAVWRSLGKVGRMEARRLRDEFVAEVRRSDGRLNRAWRRTPFADAADAWHAMQISLVEVDELAQTTLEGYEISVRRHLKPWFGARAVHSVTPDDLVTWHASQRQQGAAPWSIKGRWNALRGVLGYAVRQGWIASNPADALTSRERPKGGGSRKRFLRDEEMRALLAQASGRYRLLIAVLLFGLD